MPSCSASFFNSSVVLRDFTLRMTLIPEDVFLTVTKSDVETGTAQGDASLAGAVYGIYKEEELTEKTNRLNILNGLLNVDKRENELVDGMPDNDYEILKFKNKEHER